MANRFPLIVDTTDGNRLKEIPSGDSLDFSSVGIANLTSLSLSNDPKVVKDYIQPIRS